MDFFEQFKQKLGSSQIIRMPSMNIHTFGSTNYLYYHLSKIDDAKTRVREGQLIIKKPIIIHPNMDTDIVDGFSSEIQKFAEKLFGKYNHKLRLLGYQFQHIHRENWIEKDRLNSVLVELLKTSQDSPMITLLMGEEQYWEISLLKLYAKVIEKSFHINIAEFEERGMFDSNGVPPKVYREIEELFVLVEKYPNRIKDLGNALLRYNLFEKYEDRFFKAMGKGRNN